jgi:hypothetical protein
MSSTDVETERRRIEMPIEQALEDEWSKGIAERRSGDESKPFVGDALVHMHDQLLGAINYKKQIGREDDSTTQMLDQHEIDPVLRKMVFLLRAIYRLREVRRARLVREALDAAKRDDRPN